MMVQQMQKLLDGLQTACQQACPSEAIVFGNINRQELSSATRAACWHSRISR